MCTLVQFGREVLTRLISNEIHIHFFCIHFFHRKLSDSGEPFLIVKSWLAIQRGMCLTHSNLQIVSYNFEVWDLKLSFFKKVEHNATEI